MADNRTPALSPDLLKVTTLASQLFGTQYAVYLQTHARRLEVCQSFPLIEKAWIETGIIGDEVEERVCDAVDVPPKVTIVINEVTSAVTGIFVTHVLNSGKKPLFAGLCRYLNDALLVALSIRPDSHKTICHAAGLAVPKSSSSAKINETLRARRLVYASLIFGVEAALGFADIVKLRDACRNFNRDHRPGVLQLGLNADAVGSIYCRFSRVLPSPAQARELIKGFSSIVYGLELLAASPDKSAYRKFLCANLDDAKMRGIAVDPRVVRRVVCKLGHRIVEE